MILIIDDEKRWVNSYEEALKLSGYECKLVSNVDELGKWLDDDSNELANVKLVVLDIMMAPQKRYEEDDTEDGMNTGQFVFEEIRQKNASLPIIVLTNKDHDADGGKVASRCSHYLLKEEVTPKALIQIIDNILNGLSNE